MLFLLVTDRKNDLSLTLLQLRVLLIDNVHFTFTANDLAISRTFLYGCSNFHVVAFVGGAIRSFTERALRCPIKHFIVQGNLPAMPSTGAKYFLFIAVRDSAPGKIVRRHFYCYLIARQNPNVIHPHFPGNSCHNFVVIFQANAKHSIRQGFFNDTVLFDQILLRHNSNFGVQR